MSIVDFAIITGLTEEFEVLRKVFPQMDEYSENADIWYRTRVKSGKGDNYEIVCTFQNDMGPLDAANLTVKIIERWDPAYIILVGIAGSFHPDVKLGDVVVSQQIFYYDPGKATHKGIQYRPQGYPCSTVLIRQAEALRLAKQEYSAWQSEAQNSASDKSKYIKGIRKHTVRFRSAQKSLREHRPEIHFGTVASGSLVVADRNKQKELLTLHGKIVGTEMEGAGMLHATFRHELPTPAVVIKGISDAADRSKAREDAKGYWRELAKENSVRLAFELIRRGQIRSLRTDQFDLDPTPGSIADARAVILDASAPGVSYQAFPRLIVPRGPLTQLKISIEAYGNDGSLDIIKGVIRYQDRNGKRKTMELAASGSIQVIESIAANPVEVYTMVRGTPVRLAFTVVSPNNERTTEWVPESRKG